MTDLARTETDLTVPVRTHYPALFQPTANGFLVRFRDVPEALTQGDDETDAMGMAEDALATALEFYFETDRLPPLPSALRSGERMVRLPLEADLLLHQRILDGVRKASGPLNLWWAMIEADESMAGEDPSVTLPDGKTILNFMGSGASTSVTAGHLRAFMDAAGDASRLLATNEDRAWGERLLKDLIEDGQNG
jgi:predicted RNase H-like HicB family nuclease